MNISPLMLAMLTPTEQEVVEFAILAGLFLLIAIGTLVWFFYIRKRRHRIRKSRDERSHLNPTLAQKGGLPPPRRQNRTFGDNPPPMP